MYEGEQCSPTCVAMLGTNKLVLTFEFVIELIKYEVSFT